MATKNWDKLVDVTTPVYETMPVSHMSYRRPDNIFHWSIIQEQVHAELKKLKNEILEKIINQSGRFIRKLLIYNFLFKNNLITE